MMRNVLFPAVLAAAVVSATFEARATVPDLEGGVSVSVSLPSNPTCPKGNVVPIKLVVNNALKKTISVTNATTVGIEEGTVLNDMNGEEIPIAETKTGRISAAATGESAQWPQQLNSKGSLNRRWVMTVPSTEGYYKEVVTTKWKYTDSTDEYDVQFSFAYLFENGCIETVSDEEYEMNTAQYVDSFDVVDGVTTKTVARAGYSSLETYAGEALDSAVDVVTAPGGEASAEAAAATASATLDSAVTYNYCVRVRYRDNFVNPPASDHLTGMSWWRPYGDGNYHNFIGLQVELWDRNGISPDAYIKTSGLYYSADGNYCCLDFSWDPSTRHDGLLVDTYPDPYIKTKFVVMDTEHDDTGKKIGRLCSDGCSCNTPVEFSWRGSYYPNLNETYGYADLNFGGLTSTPNAQAMQMATFQKFFRTWRSYYMTGNINAYWVNDGAPQTLSPTCIELTKV